MCGRKYDGDTAAIERAWHIGRHNNNPFRDLFDARPGQDLPVLRMNPEAGIELDAFRWGLVPSWWKKSIKEVGSTFNATAEKIKAKNGMWWGPFLRRRCLVPIYGYYEWQYQADGRSVRHYIKLRSAELFALACLWDAWQQPDGSTLNSYAVVTCPANPLMAKIHNKPKKSEGPRMPVILTGETARAWFDPNAGQSQEDLLNLLAPYSQEAMIAYPVANTASNPADLIVPIGEPVALP
jgi:putative SOS response-associated peptidase YedK